MSKNNILIKLYYEKNIECIYQLFKDVEFLNREYNNPTLISISEELEMLKRNMLTQIRNIEQIEVDKKVYILYKFDTNINDFKIYSIYTDIPSINTMKKIGIPEQYYKDIISGNEIEINGDYFYIEIRKSENN